MLANQNYEGSLQKTHWRKAALRAEKFGDLITTDHKVLNEKGESWNNHRFAVVLQDYGFNLIRAKTKTSQDTEKSWKRFLEPSRKPGVVNRDISLECGKSGEELSWNHRTCAPHRSGTNRIPERAVRRMKEGTERRNLSCIAMLLDEKWWTDFMACYCYLRDVEDLLAEVKTSNERRFGEPFKVPIIPFGAMVEYHPFLRDQSKLHQFGKKVLPEICLGHALIAVRIRKGDIRIADLHELEKLDAPEICPRRVNAKEVLIS